jgi:Protein of unknown function (DUF998)
VALLHVVRPELSPVSHRLSEYANGAYGSLMTASFLTLGTGMVALGLGLRVARTTSGWFHLVPVAVIAAGLGMVVSGLFPTDPAGVPTTSERVHSLASGAASLALIGAALLSILGARSRPHRLATDWTGALAIAALTLGAVSPVLHDTAWTGLSQRLLWLTLLAWLLLTAWQLSDDPGVTRRSACDSVVVRAAPFSEVPEIGEQVHQPRGR